MVEATALVLGGYGFVGGAVADRLERKGWEVHRLSRRNGLDMRVEESARIWFRSVDPHVIVNCAAHVGSVHYVMSHEEAVFQDNARMALNLYEVANEICPRAIIINPLANCSYPGDADIQRETEWLSGPPHPTVLAFAATRRLLYTLSRLYDMQTNTIILPGIFGPGDYTDPDHTHALSGMIVRMIRAKRAGEPRFEVWGSGMPIREWGYIDDVAEVVSQLADRVLPQPVNFGQGVGATIRESAEAICAAVGYGGELWFNTDRADGAKKKVLSDTLFRAYFPDFKFTDHAEAIRRTVAYYEEVL